MGPFPHFPHCKVGLLVGCYVVQDPMPLMRYFVNPWIVMLVEDSRVRKGKPTPRINACLYETKSLVLPR